MLQLFRKIAFPFSLVYALVVHLRNLLYNVGIFKSISYKTPTLCVGNLSVGGTGKTPMIEFLIRLLDNHKVAVLSRGYKRKSEGFLLADENSSVLDLGDEPYQLHQKFPETTVAVDADRRNGITQLESRVQPEIILLDDAFQHRRVKPNFSILLTAYGQLYVDDWYLPTGNLRDSKREAKRANIIVVTKCPEGLSEAEKAAITQKLQPLPHQKVVFSKLEYNHVLKGEGSASLSLTAIQDKKIALVTGIASPGPLVQYLKSLGLEFDYFEFRDHHHFSDRDVQQFKNHEVILTTEKDYVRLKGKAENLFYLEVAHSFTTEDRAFLKKTIESLS
ncbi:tetraacyldisaccharide 4'-kinase [Muricauda sp. CAU 1633]|uniref:tetraacyldisaccharide 4'-kinase n=1 Tax=Allomuricauda sp. CAU 1633 TaxID=2816036 RepID=UPI001A8D3755|nr:tetraacyldisaccharide 4'-kinase [Muricauda sp. CAU 1633]MBO0322593.1 tetraacyldisaccharide 4'-kinase [Muricauda sp. CAU 1633]